MKEVLMRRKSLWIGLALALLVGLAAGIIHRAQRVQLTTNVAKVEVDVREHLPVGSSRAEVASFLDQRGIPHSYVGESEGAPEYSRTEMAMIRGASQSWLIRGDIQILFKFDEHGKLLKHSVREIFTGP
jgi:hypothetical protein